MEATYSIDAIIDNTISKLRAGGCVAPPENLKSHYLKACFCLSKLRQRRMDAQNAAAAVRGKPRHDKNEALLIELFSRELPELRRRKA